MHEDHSIRVIVVDDHPVVRSGLRTMLESAEDFAVVGRAGSGHEALKIFEHTEAGVPLLDLRMPGNDGLDLLKRFNRQAPSIKVLVLTNYHSDEDVFRAFQAGVMAYLLKTSSDDEIFTAIRDVHAGRRCVPPSIAKQLAERLARIELTPGNWKCSVM